MSEKKIRVTQIASGNGQKPGQQSEQHDKTGQTQKRPSQPGNEADQNDNQKDQGGQRRAS